VRMPSAVRMRRRSIYGLDEVRRVPGLGNAPLRELAEVSSLLDRAALKAGDELTREGGWERQAFVVLDGHADVLIRGCRIGSVGPGEFVGEVAMIDRGPHTRTVRATSDMKVFVMGAASFLDLLTYPRVAGALLEQMWTQLPAAELSIPLVVLPTDPQPWADLALGHDGSFAPVRVPTGVRSRARVRSAATRVRNALPVRAAV
jgi:CRP/FNR family cyclic AMP-dependent transcriptional regulator